MLEALRGQVAVKPRKFGLILQFAPSAQPLGQRSLDECLLIERAEGFIDGAPGDRGGDAGAFNLPPDSHATVPLDRRLRARNCLRNPPIVDGPLRLQAEDGIIDRVGIVVAAGEALTHLRLGKFAPPEHLERVDVRRAHAVIMNRMDRRPVFPTPAHESAARLVDDFFAAQSSVDTVLVVNSCARGTATPESDLDLAILVEPSMTIMKRQALKGDCCGVLLSRWAVPS